VRDIVVLRIDHNPKYATGKCWLSSIEQG
jgi:hypothetical protein